LKTYQLTVNGHQYNVDLEDLDASPIVVKVNGKPFEVVVSEQGPARSPGRPAPGEEPEIEMDAYVPSVYATYQEIDVDEPEPQGGAPDPEAVAEGALTVSAPMPGTILDIAVQPGDRVSQGDTLCNLEAMKMKSPIRSPVEGSIAQVLISEGQNVAYGDLLFTLD
jgi:biotin carboxyl carrier protein